MRIAILAPMPMELRSLRAPLGLAPSAELGDGLLRGATGRVEVVAGLTGVGLRAGARAAERILDAASPDHLLVVGIAGGIGPSVTVGDLVLPEVVENLETGETLRPTPLGGRPARGALVSSGALESPEEAKRLMQRGVVAVDMETAAIGGVCARRGVPWSVFRAISDRADDGGTDAAILGLLRPDGSPDVAAAARLVLREPRRIPQLVRLARGAGVAARAAAAAALATIESL